MKKIGALIFLCLIFFVQVVYAEDILSGLEGKVGELEEAKKNVEDFTEKIKETKDGSFFGKWKQNLLGMKPVQVIDNFLSEISIVFRVLMGMDYNFSLAFLFVFFVWFYLIFNIAYLLRATSIFAGGISWIISFAIVLIFGQIGFFPKVVEWAQLLFLTLLKFVNFVIIAAILFAFIILISFFFFENLFSLMRDYYQNKVKKIKKRIDEGDRALFHNLVSGLSNIFNKDSKKLNTGYKKARQVYEQTKKPKKNNSDKKQREAMEHYIDSNS